MNYLALAKGAKGLLLYAPGAEIPDTQYTDDISLYPRQWTEVLKIASEIRHLAPVLAAGAPAATVRLEDRSLPIHYIELQHEGLHTLISVNVEGAMALAKWRFDESTRPRVLFEDRTLSQEAHTVEDLFQPLEVHVYQWRPRPGA